MKVFQISPWLTLCLLAFCLSKASATFYVTIDSYPSWRDASDPASTLSAELLSADGLSLSDVSWDVYVEGDSGSNQQFSPSSTDTSVSWDFPSGQSPDGYGVTFSATSFTAIDSSGNESAQTASPGYCYIYDTAIVVGNISYQGLARVPINVDIPVHISLTPSYATGAGYQLNIANLGGTGAAHFDNASSLGTSIAIDQTQDVDLVGSKNSNGSYNIELQAQEGSIYRGDPQYFTVSTWPISIGCGLRGDLTTSLTTGFNVTLRIQSESGTVGDLSNCDGREQLTANSFPSPPFKNPQSVSVGTFHAAGGDAPQNSAGSDITAFVGDTHLFPMQALLDGTDTGSFVMHQAYQFQDRVVFNNWTLIPTGSYVITVAVQSASAGGRQVTVTKTGDGVYGNPLVGGPNPVPVPIP